MFGENRTRADVHPRETAYQLGDALCGHFIGGIALTVEGHFRKPDSAAVHGFHGADQLLFGQTPEDDDDFMPQDGLDDGVSVHKLPSFRRPMAATSISGNPSRGWRKVRVSGSRSASSKE